MNTEHMNKIIDDMANEFLRWPLPKSVCADRCATEQSEGRIGTNLLTFTEAREMFAAIAGPRLPPFLPAQAGESSQLKKVLTSARMAMLALEACTIEGISRLRKTPNHISVETHLRNQCSAARVPLDHVIETLESLIASAPAGDGEGVKDSPTGDDLKLSATLYDEAHHYAGRFDEYQKVVGWLVRQHVLKHAARHAREGRDEQLILQCEGVLSERDKLQEDLRDSIAKHYETHKQLKEVRTLAMSRGKEIESLEKRVAASDAELSASHEFLSQVTGFSMCEMRVPEAVQALVQLYNRKEDKPRHEALQLARKITEKVTLHRRSFEENVVLILNILSAGRPPLDPRDTIRLNWIDHDCCDLGASDNATTVRRASDGQLFTGPDLRAAVDAASQPSAEGE